MKHHILRSLCFSINKWHTVLRKKKICLDVHTSEDMSNEKPRTNVVASLSEENEFNILSDVFFVFIS